MSPEDEHTEGYSIQEVMHSENGVLTIGRARAVVITEAAYVYLTKILHEHAPQAIKYGFYDMGYRAGEEMMGIIADRAEDPEKAFRYMVETYRQSGYGNLDVEQFDLSKPEVMLSGTNLFETAVAAEAEIYRSPRCVDHYSRGMFAGFMSRLLGKEVVCEEIACQARGDERCQFVILPFGG